MSSANAPLALKARYVFPVESPPLPEGVVAICGQRIVAVGEKAGASSTRDLGNVAILPGLVNAHAHLEFSDLQAPLGQPSLRLPDWIRLVVAHRRNRQSSWLGTVNPLMELRRIVLRGLAEVVAGGATTAAEIATVAWGPKQLLGELVDCTIFWEQIGLRSDRLLPITEKAGRWVEAIGRRCWAWKPGLSPHAPYSAHPELVAELSRLSASAQVPLAMHLAESQEELELLESGGGPLVDLLKELQAWAPEAIPRGVRPMDYLRTLAKADRALVAHGNFLSPDEIAFLGAHADRMSVVFCPRTHIHFGHPRYPLGQMAAAGVNVALGTDSRASSPDLSLLEELRVVAARFPDVAPETVLNMGALAGARALGLESELGSLSPGKLANLTVVELPDRSEDDPFSLLFDSTKPVQMTCRRGRWTPATN